MQIGIIGLGKMGRNMVVRLLQGKQEVFVFNRSLEPMQEVAKLGARPSTSLANLVKQLKKPRIIWLMLPAGKVTENYLHQLEDLLEPNDIVIDGGNAFYKDSVRRAAKFKKRNIHFLDIGVSGGIWGLKKGYCLMVGGEESAYKKIEPILKALTPKNGYAYFGKSGSGHLVKMVHNGIEYALLQAYGEGFAILNAKNAKQEFAIDLAKLCRVWQHGSVVRSWLLDLAIKVFQKDAKLESAKGFVEDSGEGRWTVTAALEEDVAAPAITLSLLERFHSREKESFSAKFIAMLRKQFGGHAVK